MGLEGKLTDMPVVDLLRVFQRSLRSGKLVIWTEGESALVRLMDGQAINAVVMSTADRRPLHTGEQAIFHIFTWSNGQFRYNPDSASGSYPITIRRPTGTLIAEALQRRRAPSKAPSSGDLTMQTHLLVLPQMAGADEYIRLSLEEWRVLTTIGQQSTVEQIAATTEIPAGKVLALVAHLIDCGLVMPVPLANLPQRRLVVEMPEAIAGTSRAQSPITNLTRAIRRRLEQIAVGA